MWDTVMMSWFGTQAHSRECMRKRPAEQTAAWFNVRPYRKQHDIGRKTVREMQSCSGVEKLQHSQLCENHQAGNDNFKIKSELRLQ